MEVRGNGKWGREPNFANVSFPGTLRLRWLHSNCHLSWVSWTLPGDLGWILPHSQSKETRRQVSDLDGIGSLDTRGQGAGQHINKSLEDCKWCSLYIIYFQNRSPPCVYEGHESLPAQEYLFSPMMAQRDCRLSALGSTEAAWLEPAPAGDWGRSSRPPHDSVSISLSVTCAACEEKVGRSFASGGTAHIYSISGACLTTSSPSQVPQSQQPPLNAAGRERNCQNEVRKQNWPRWVMCERLRRRTGRFLTRPFSSVPRAPGVVTPHSTSVSHTPATQIPPHSFHSICYHLYLFFLSYFFMKNY